MSTATRSRQAKATPAAPPSFTRQPLSRPRWVTFALGPVTFTGGLHGAAADQDDPLVNLCTQGGHPPARIRRTDSCPVCTNSDRATFVKGRVSGDEITVLDAQAYQAIKDADDSFKGHIDLQMVEADEDLMLPIGSVYYVSAKGGAAANAYALAAGVVQKRPHVAFLAELSFGGAPRLFRLEVSGGVLVLREIARPEAVRERPQVAGVADRKQVQRAAELIVDDAVVPFRPEAFANRHAQAVGELIEQSSPTVGAPATAGSVDDILAQLEAKVSALKPATPAKTPRRRRPAPASTETTTASDPAAA